MWEAIYSLLHTSCLAGNGCSDRSSPPSPTGSPISRVLLLADSCELNPFTPWCLLEETQHQVKPWLLGDSPLILEDRVMSLLVPLGLSLLSPAAYSPRRLVYIPTPQATHCCLMLLSMKWRNGWQAHRSSQWVVIHNIWFLQNLKWQYRARV